MELKPYQQQVISDITLYLEKVQESKNIQEAFTDFWKEHPKTPLLPSHNSAVEPYKNNIPRVPHICVKVPTAGGKTFIACNALKPIFDSFDIEKPKTVVWLVPSITILDQTIRNLKDPRHPYRQKINSHFGNKVEVFDKSALLQGSGFNATSIYGQLNIMVFSFDSLRARNKEDRKVFQENGNLQSFELLLGQGSDLTLGAVIRYLNPLVIVDESHNAESDLSVEMLKELNPCFILDLTATPRKNSNIISYIDALELKKENMVKLPVIVYNHHDKNEVISSALQLQRQLENEAREEEKNGGHYIRPIVLFQAQPKNAEDQATFAKLKEKLIELNIPAEQIRIKTASINEIKHEDLLDRDCPVRYIITINALKEGWDCPFAYILASLADKSSAVDVEQILGRVLRQPYVTRHEFPLLNMSYVLTASSKFMDTLDNIVKGLNRAGFSSKDYKLANPEIPLVNEVAGEIIPNSDHSENDDITAGIDTSKIIIDAELPVDSVSRIAQSALAQSKDFEKIVADNNPLLTMPDAIQRSVKSFSMKDVFRDDAQSIRLPQFFLKIPAIELFGDPEREVLLEKENLLEEFALSKSGINIEFDNISSELYKVDVDETKKEHTPTFIKLDNISGRRVMNYILDPSRKGSRVKHMTDRIVNALGNFYPIPDAEVRKYVSMIVGNFTDDQFNDFSNKEYSYVNRIRQEIELHAEAYAESRFKTMFDTYKIFIKPSYSLPAFIIPGNTAKDMNRTLYEKEGSMNGFEESVINEIANMDNIEFWTRNMPKTGFRINGFINHFPDFIIRTKSHKTIIVETKGDHLVDERKIRLGNLWGHKAGDEFNYFMVYEKKVHEGTYTKDDFLKIIKEI